MANVKDLFYHGVRQQIGRVLTAMGEERVRLGLRAFDEGASNWSRCFFAMAYPEHRLGAKGDPEDQVAELLGMPGNRVPMRIVYRTFDGLSTSITRPQMRKFIESFLVAEQEREASSDAVMALLRSVDYSDVDSMPADLVTACDAS